MYSLCVLLLVFNHVSLTFQNSLYLKRHITSHSAMCENSAMESYLNCLLASLHTKRTSMKLGIFPPQRALPCAQNKLNVAALESL